MNHNLPDQPRQNEAGLMQAKPAFGSGHGPDPVPAAQMVAWDEDDDYEYDQ